MICSLDLCLDKRYLTDEDDFINSVLENPKRELNADGELVKTVGYIKNYRVTITPSKIFLNGSLSKFYLRTNAKSLSRRDVLKAVKKLKALTGLPLQNADIIRVDFAVNLFLKAPFKSYLPYFEETPGYTKGVDAYGGLKYVKQKEVANFELAVYNKLSELRVRAKEAYQKTKEYADRNGKSSLLRIELRLKSEVRKRLLPKGRRILLPHLLSGGVNRKLIMLWQKTYDAIAKNRQPMLLASASGCKEAKDILAATMIDSLGITSVLRSIDEAARRGQWSAKKKSVTKSELKKLSIYCSSTTPSHCFEEIEKAMQESVELNQWINDWSR